LFTGNNDVAATFSFILKQTSPQRPNPGFKQLREDSAVRKSDPLMNIPVQGFYSVPKDIDLRIVSVFFD
jgi:hypothetical protein